MRLRPFSSLLLLCCAAALASACNPYACVYRTRFVATTPESSAAGSPSLSGYVNFRDYSDNAPVPNDIVWNIELAGTTATPTRLVLADNRDTTRILATMPIQQSAGRISASASTVTSMSQRDLVFDLLSSNNGVLILSLSDRATPVLFRLTVTDRENWHRPNCS